MEFQRFMAAVVVAGFLALFALVLLSAAHVI